MGNFLFILKSFQAIVKTYPCGTQRLNVNPQPLDRESPPITSDQCYKSFLEEFLISSLVRKTKIGYFSSNS